MEKREYSGGKLFLEELEPGILRLTINNPERRNALDYELMKSLGALLADAGAQEDVRVLIVTGAGDQAFCSGFNIGTIRTMENQDPQVGADTLVATTLSRLEDFPVPTIAALNGHTFGVGGELAATCDFRISNGQGKYGMPPAKLGLCYHHEGLRKFLDLVGPSVAKEMFYTAEPLPMETAHRVGLVSHLVAAAEFDSFVREFARKIARGAPLSVRGMKRSFQLLLKEPPMGSKAIAECLSWQARCFLSADLLEGRAAFLEKREPRFKGK
ncbi:MAG: enoyl-CoA hydratase-related protein [Bdellovibrionota bacterium]